MILGAALLVLVALGLFVGGIATGATAFYWACVAVSVLAAVLLFAARRQMGRMPVAEGADQAGRVRPPVAERDPDARAVPPGTPPAGAAASAPPGTAAPRAVHPEAEPAVGAPDGAGDRYDAAETGDGRVASLGYAEHAGTVAGATAAGVPQERAGGPGGEPPEAAVPVDDSGEPPVEEVEVTDLLLVVDLRDEVLVVDEHPRYHVAGCPWLIGRATIPLPIDEARTDGFTPCGQCAPDRHLAQVERARRAEGRST